MMFAESKKDSKKQGKLSKAVELNQQRLDL